MARMNINETRDLMNIFKKFLTGDRDDKNKNLAIDSIEKRENDVDIKKVNK